MTASTTLTQPTEFLDFTSEPVRAFVAQALRG